MPVIVTAEVGGIQKFIFATGKLKEMIGGSEIVYQICQKEYYVPVLKEIGCAREALTETDGNDWHMLLQANAGKLALILPDEQVGRAFLLAYSKKALEDFPGLPLFGAQAPAGWDTAAYKEGRRLVEDRIKAQRAMTAPGAGMPMLPVLRAARLDGLPAVAEDRSGADRELISLSSYCKRSEELLKDSRNRLQEYAGLKDEQGKPRVQWPSDMEELAPNGAKIALIHMDGNSMGKLFGNALDKAADLPVAESVRSLRALSESIEAINRDAFRSAVGALLDYIREFDKSAIKDRTLVMPLRPLVIGGDDITLVIRADLALFFVNLFVSCYESLAAARGLGLSLGVGMTVMDSAWPFAKAFALVEDLTKNAKKITDGMAERPSSIDYLVITEEVDRQLSDLRTRVYTAVDGASLTSKPFMLSRNFLSTFLEEGREILETLPRSAVRPAFAACRKGMPAAREHWLNMKENLKRGLGGRKGKLMAANRFEHLFPNNYFNEETGVTSLGDYLELTRLLPAEPACRDAMLQIMRHGGCLNV